MRTAKNIRKPLRRYERSIEPPVTEETEQPEEPTQVYADITASTASPQEPLKLTAQVESEAEQKKRKDETKPPLGKKTI
jgi:hypothetical protein